MFTLVNLLRSAERSSLPKAAGRKPSDEGAARGSSGTSARTRPGCWWLGKRHGLAMSALLPMAWLAAGHRAYRALRAARAQAQHRVCAAVGAWQLRTHICVHACALRSSARAQQACCCAMCSLLKAAAAAESMLLCHMQPSDGCCCCCCSCFLIAQELDLKPVTNFTFINLVMPNRCEGVRCVAALRRAWPSMRPGQACSRHV